MDLPRACTEDLALVYQPIIDTLSGQICGAEALLRYHHPKEGIQLPAFFLTDLLSSSRLLDVTRWILRKAFAACNAWTRATGRQFFIAVNLSLAELQSPDIVAIVSETASSARLEPDRIVIEVSEEGDFLNSANAVRNVRCLSALGFLIALDDFGAGYSSLRYLLEIAATTVKLDARFIQGLPNSRYADVIVGCARMAERLGSRVVIEGVSAPAHLAFMKMHGLRYAQGYYFGAPSAVDSIARMLVRNKTLDGA